MLEHKLADYSLRDKGVTLYIDDLSACNWSCLCPVVVDVEHDEKGNFVGLGWATTDMEVFYHTVITPELSTYLAKSRLVGHNIKSDIRLMKEWGIPVDEKNIYYDTMLAAYAVNPVRESQGLKDLAREILDFTYPRYRDIVGKGHSKVTLDKQPTDIVANYCGSDVAATYGLYQHFDKTMTADERKVFGMEMDINRLLYRMEEQGIDVDVPYLRYLSTLFGDELSLIQKKVNDISGHVVNMNSPKQMVELLYKQFGLPTQYKRTKRKNKKTGHVEWIEVVTTDKNALIELEGMHDVIPHIQRHRELSKLNSTYVTGILKLSSLPTVHTSFNQVSVNESQDEWDGIRTGRLSSSGPNLHSIPTRTETGHMLRKAFIPSRKNTILLCFDYSQIEYRLLAHFTHEPVLLQAFRTGKDVHEETGRMFGVERYLGKTLNFAAIYGAQAKKMANTAKIDRERAQELLDAYWAKLPYVRSWINVTKMTALKKGYICTLGGRRIPIANIRSSDKMERWKAERQAVNYIIQGSAADIIKMAMLKCHLSGYTPILQVHDELLFEVDSFMDQYVHEVMGDIKGIMENVVKLTIPLTVDGGKGQNWSEAKGD